MRTASGWIALGLALAFGLCALITSVCSEEETGEYAALYNHLGNVLFQAGLEEDALRYYNISIQVDANFSEPWNNK